jgi:HEAT repeat protein
MSGRTLVLLISGLVLAGAAAFLLLRGSPPSDRAASIIAALQPDARRPSTPRQQGSPDTTAAPDPARLPDLVRDTSWMVRLTASDAVMQSKNLPEQRRAELLLDALGQEVSTPAAGRPFTGSYLPLSGMLRLRYAHMLEDLGRAAANPARAAMQKETGERREWAAIAWGASGTSDAAPELRRLLRTSNHSDVRMSAAYFLGRLGDRSAVADLKAALSDSATARITTDDTGDRGRILYPVREQAAGALMALGIKVERDGHRFTAN